MFTVPGLNRICRESYNDPAEVYDRLKRMSMSIVTITDHDSIDGAESLRRHPDFFLSEEVTVRMPSGTEMHMGVYGITERDHAEIQRRRNDFIALLMYLTERKLFFSANHVFSGLTGRREAEDFHWFESYVPAFETRNGQMWPKANESAARLATRLGKIAIAGSDSHTIAGVGHTFTEVLGARTVDEFFAGLRAGRERELRQTDGGRVQHRAVTFLGQAVDAGAITVCGAGARIYGGALDERDSFLPEMVLGDGARGETQADAVGFGFELRG
jgi:predicted metal-dependent phosphoesterase TrpH